MHEHEHQQHQPDETPEHEPASPVPAIYVASLSDFNNGELHGAWIPANQDPDDIWVQIQTNILDTSPTYGAEEIAIHDHQHFAGWQPHEHEPIDTIASVANAIIEHGPAISHWIDYLDDPDQAIASFDTAYLGHWPTMTAYAEHLTQDLGLTITVEPESWAHYVKLDTEQLARDLDIELATAEDPDGGVHVFDPSLFS